MQLKILTWQNEEIASDALSIHGYEHYEATDYALAAWYPRQPKALGTPGTPAQAATPSERSSDFTKWWADGDEPLYYIVSSKVICRMCQLSPFHFNPRAHLRSGLRRGGVQTSKRAGIPDRCYACGHGCLYDAGRGGGEAKGWG